jgi:hypothetical protein
MFLASILNHLEPLLDMSMADLLNVYKQYDMLLGKDIVVMPKKREDPTRLEVRSLCRHSSLLRYFSAPISHEIITNMLIWIGCCC